LVTIKNIKMKEQTLINMKHDMSKLAQGVHNNIQNLVHINTMVQGLLETVKRMPGYEKAIKELLEEQKPETNVE